MTVNSQRSVYAIITLNITKFSFCHIHFKSYLMNWGLTDISLCTKDTFGGQVYPPNMCFPGTGLRSSGSAKSPLTTVKPVSRPKNPLNLCVFKDCVCECMHIYVPPCVCRWPRGLEGDRETLMMEFQVVMNNLTWVLGRKLHSSGRAGHTLTMESTPCPREYQFLNRNQKNYLHSWPWEDHVQRWPSVWKGSEEYSHCLPAEHLDRWATATKMHFPEVG